MSDAQTYDLEDRLVDFSVMVLGMTEQLPKTLAISDGLTLFFKSTSICMRSSRSSTTANKVVSIQRDKK